MVLASCSGHAGLGLNVVIGVGGVLQVIGIFATAVQVAAIRGEFGAARTGGTAWRLGMQALWRDLTKRLRTTSPPPAPPPARSPVDGAAAVDSLVAGSSRQAAANPEHEVQRQLNDIDRLLQYMVDRLNRELPEIRDEYRNAEQRLRSELDGLRATVTQATSDVERTRSKLQSLATGGLRLQGWSVGFIIVGTLLVTAGAFLALRVPIVCHP